MSYKNIVYGKNIERRNYSRVQTNVELPNLIEIQTKSFDWFVHEGIEELFNEISPIRDHGEKLELYFKNFEFDEPKYTISEAKRNLTNYSRPLKADVSLVSKETGEIKEQKIFLGEFPIMTPWGTFIITGAERVVVTQIIRSAGAFYSKSIDKKTAQVQYYGQIIPTRGAWIEFEMGSRNIWYAKLDRSKKIPLTTFLRAMGLNSNKNITELYDPFGKSEYLSNTFDKDETFGSDDALEQLYDKLRPGEKANPEGARNYLASRLFEIRRYDLASVGRYKVNKKLDVLQRIYNMGLNTCLFASDVIDPNTGKVVFAKNQVIDAKVMNYLENHRELYRKTFTYEQMLEGNSVILEVLDVCHEKDKDNPIRLVGNNQDEEVCHVTLSDILAAVSYFINLHEGVGRTDDIDHLGNRRLRLIGELLQNQFRIGLTKMEKNVKDRMSTSNDTKAIVPQNLINIRTLTSSIREFFGSSQLSQFMDQINPLSELTHKRRLSALGAGGLTRDRAGFEVRDVHVSHYGRICPIETPEGQNIGLINSLATYARVDKYGFIETPYLKVIQAEDGRTLVSNDPNDVIYLTADREEDYYIAQANTEVNEQYEIIEQKVTARHMGETLEIGKEKIDLIDVSPKQIVAVSTACIPFLEHDDANRALMGANMQRQAIPLLKPEAAFVATGIEAKAAKDSGVAVIAEEEGFVEYVDALKIIVKETSGNIREYKLIKYERSNHSTCVNQRPIVKKGEFVKKGDVLADGPSMDRGEMALGRNVVIAFMTWNGYNYEDAVVMSERLVQDDVYTSIHIEKHEVEVRDTKLGKEEITRELDDRKEAIANLDEYGIIRLGAEVKENDILVGKVTPKGQTDPTPEERLSRALFADSSKEVRNTSLKVPHGGGGIVHRIEHFRRKDGDELPPSVNEFVRVFIVQKRKITEGDKMAGRHGNKGVISKILPQEDMPYMEDGTPIDIMLNPQGIPSRLNIGQVLEIHLGMAAQKLGIHIATPVFDGVRSDDLAEIMKEAGMNEDGKTVLIDGRTGRPFDNRISVGVMYMIKLAHMVDDKLHARSEGPYALVTQQPMGGKAQNGGQRFGEMEVWALEAYGAAYTLREMLTIKSDDMVGRNKVYKAIVDGEDIPAPGIPEAFRVLIKELQGLGISIKLIDNETGEDVANMSLVEELALATKTKKAN
ncbi:MAG TPA: DNA-directed RNA polymerase subunit beta [Bacilli bacterium]|nr:DNA-directed RNA polymerase subunit beta [Bacilli bacterium]HOR18041.1 DNA-directed RNA polymerase subunit beta [Bacilli bacterium]HPL55745.1 DNA-directed RNA polymerase subunit beta [Bacilli bacterium]